MKARSTLGIGCVALLALFSPVAVEGNPLKSPKRVVDGRTVDLGPLFRWWNKHEGERPLSAWKHVGGSIVDTNTWGWVVSARLETGRPHGKPGGSSASSAGRNIILRNPPLRDRAEFEALAAKLRPLEEERSKVASQKAQAKSRVRAASHGWNGYRTRAQVRAGRQARFLEKQADEQLAALDKQIKDLRGKLADFPNQDHYVVDCLALDTGTERSGMAVFDHGMSWP